MFEGLRLLAGLFFLGVSSVVIAVDLWAPEDCPSLPILVERIDGITSTEALFETGPEVLEEADGTKDPVSNC